MRKFSFIVLLLAAATVAVAQSEPVLVAGTKEFGLFGTGGTGVGASSDWKFFNAGVRLGMVLTPRFGPGPLRGNLEYTADIIPVWLVRQPQYQLVNAVPLGLPANTYLLRNTGRNETVYGGGFAPVILKWNFTAHKRIVPYFAAEGGVIFTRKDLPLPNSSNVNFTPGGAFGIQWFRSPKRAIVTSVHITHFSNASMGEHNPGINASVLFRVGYSWFK